MAHSRKKIYRPLASLGLALLAVLGMLLGSAVLRPAQADSPTSHLPDLVADPPDHIDLTTDGSTGVNRLLLRFNGYVHNIGPGALDFRGSRSAPEVSQKTEEEVEWAREHEAGLPQKTEEELATPPMNVFQRVFSTNEDPTNIERPHSDEPSAAQMLYVSADGHHHWHLQHVAYYSLWNATKSAPVAPAQKVGFCLEDSEHVEPAIGPSHPVYADNVPPYRDFCQQYRPNATSLYEGISAGWRDLYERTLAFQWVDASDVLPGEYWLKEEVNTTDVVKETGTANVPAYATSPTIIPGFDAEPQSLSTAAGASATVVLKSQSWEDEGTPHYAIVTSPAHGMLTESSGDTETYTPEPGYTGADSFTYSAADPDSEFPTHPAVATVAIQVTGGQGGGQVQPTVAIAGAPASMFAGTSVQLSATTNDNAGVTWSANAGSITSGGLYTAPSEPPAAGAVTIVAQSATGAVDTTTIAIQPVPPSVPSPAAPSEAVSPPYVPATPTAPESTPTHGLLADISLPDAMLVNRTLVMTTTAGEAGRVRLSAYLGRRLIGTCAAETPGDRSFTCRLRLARGVSTRARISVVASLRIGKHVLQSTRPPAPVAPMKMKGAMSLLAHGYDSSSLEFVCSPAKVGPSGAL